MYLRSTTYNTYGLNDKDNDQIKKKLIFLLLQIQECSNFTLKDVHTN